MHEYWKEHPEKAFMLFTKVFIYKNNSGTKWSELTQDQKDDPEFKWSCTKMFVLSKRPISPEDAKRAYENSPEMDDVNLPNSTNSKADDPHSGWPSDFVIYPFFPCSAYDVRLLINTVGLRRLHFFEEQE